MIMTKRLWIVTAALLFSAASASAQSYGMGPGMMGGYGMGPEMMGGPGMMNGYGMGPGMMGGYGMPHGMMGGYGMGGMEYAVPDLTSDQRSKIAAAQKEFRQKQWQSMEKMQELHFQAEDIYREGKFDEQAARKNYDAMAAARKQMFENMLEQRKRIDAILTPQQREQLQRRPGPGR
ncbi:periplasmic heavy metal sensor [Noviherbaspirillum sp. UKPF54]|nr:periplasmic heavy metal sensor [Noviherbaspirillum sp. UKPF54]